MVKQIGAACANRFFLIVFIFIFLYFLPLAPLTCFSIAPEDDLVQSQGLFCDNVSVAECKLLRWDMVFFSCPLSEMHSQSDE